MAGTRVRVHDREVDLRLVRVEVQEELVDLVHNCFGTSVRPVDLVHNEDDGKPRLERLAEDEPCLGEGPSLASTRRSTPSTIVRPRSTSPPKSAWPGVSTIFTFVSPI